MVQDLILSLTPSEPSIQLVVQTVHGVDVVHEERTAPLTQGPVGLEVPAPLRHPAVFHHIGDIGRRVELLFPLGHVGALETEVPEARTGSVETVAEGEVHTLRFNKRQVLRGGVDEDDLIVSRVPRDQIAVGLVVVDDRLSGELVDDVFDFHVPEVDGAVEACNLEDGMPMFQFSPFSASRSALGPTVNVGEYLTAAGRDGVVTDGAALLLTGIPGQ